MSKTKPITTKISSNIPNINTNLSNTTTISKPKKVQTELINFRIPKELKEKVNTMRLNYLKKYDIEKNMTEVFNMLIQKGYDLQVKEKPNLKG